MNIALQSVVGNRSHLPEASLTKPFLVCSVAMQRAWYRWRGRMNLGMHNRWQQLAGGTNHRRLVEAGEPPTQIHGLQTHPAPIFVPTS